MDTMTSQAWALVGVVAVLALLTPAAWFFYGKKQSDRLGQRFGPEYSRAIEDFSSRPKTESELEARESGVERIKLVAVLPSI